MPTSTTGDAGDVVIRDFKNIAFAATINMSDTYTESDWPVSANLMGWMTVSGDSQIFMQVDMTKPVERSFEILTLNSFDVHLRDVEEDQWYFISENSERGPLEDIVLVTFLAFGFAAVEDIDALEPVHGGYVRKNEGSWGSAMILFDEEYLLQKFVLSDPDGNELISVSISGYNEQYSVLTPVKGDPLPEDYWGSP